MLLILSSTVQPKHPGKSGTLVTAPIPQNAKGQLVAAWDKHHLGLPIKQNRWSDLPGFRHTKGHMRRSEQMSRHSTLTDVQ